MKWSFTIMHFTQLILRLVPWNGNSSEKRQGWSKIHLHVICVRVHGILQHIGIETKKEGTKL